MENLETLAKELNEKFDAFKKEVGEKADTKSILELRTIVDGFDFKGLEEKHSAEITELKAGFQKQIDEIGIKLSVKSQQKKESKTFKQALVDIFSGDEFKKFAEKSISKTKPIEIKLAGDMLESGNLNQDGVAPVILPDRRINPLMYVDRKFNLRDAIAVGTTTSNTVDFVKEENYQDGVAMQVEGNAKGQSEFDLIEASVKVETIATFFRVSRQMLDDISYLASYISNRASKKLRNKEDQQILFGNGTSPQITGVSKNATVFAAGVFAGNVPGANEYDVLRIAVSNLNVAYYSASLVIVNPVDSAKMDLIKDLIDNYLLPRFVTDSVTGVKSFMGLPVFETTAIPAGKFLIGDFQNGVELLDRQGLNVQLSDSDANNFTTNKVTIRIEERIALPIYRDEAFIYGDFDTAIKAIDKAIS